MILPSEGLVANITGVGPLVGMSPFMDQQIIRFCEMSIAEFTYELFLWSSGSSFRRWMMMMVMMKRPESGCRRQWLHVRPRVEGGWRRPMHRSRRREADAAAPDRCDEHGQPETSGRLRWSRLQWRRRRVHLRPGSRFGEVREVELAASDGGRGRARRRRRVRAEAGKREGVQRYGRYDVRWRSSGGGYGGCRSDGGGGSTLRLRTVLHKPLLMVRCRTCRRRKRRS